MDIPVNRLNQRLSLQLPAELPLGLVFVVGRVRHLETQEEPGTSAPQVWFELEEADHTLTCALSERAAAEVTLKDDSRIRAGGHLVFDTRHAHYYLLVRDVEILAAQDTLSEPAASGGRSALPPLLDDIKKRAAAARMPQADLPHWVQRMAPPEARLAQDDELPTTAVSPTAAPALDADLVSFLSAAMEDLQDVELTPDILADVLPNQPPAPAAEAAATVAAEAEAIGEEAAAAKTAAAVAETAGSGDSAAPRPPAAVGRPAARSEADWLVLLVVVSSLIVVGAILFTLVALLLR